MSGRGLCLSLTVEDSQKNVQELLLCREPKLNYVEGAESRAKGYARKPLPVYYVDNSYFQ